MAEQGSGPAPEEGRPSDGVRAWFTGRLPEGWFDGPPTVTVDRDEVVVVGRLPSGADTGAGDEVERAALRAGRVARFRESTRDHRIGIAREAEHRFGRRIAWGVETEDGREVFTSASVPVMTRLRQPERLVLDTLVEAGVARSRSDALVWCVRTVGRNADGWLTEVREALRAVQRLRETGPR